MNKLFISAVLAMSFMAMPVAAQQTTMTKAEIKAAMKAEKAQKKKEKEKSSSSSVVAPAPKPVVVVTPTPAPVAPAPAPVTPTPVAPAPVIDAFTQSQINKALARPQVHPLASCTYCAAYAASIGDFDLVNAIGAPYTPPAPVTTAPAAPATEAPAPAPAAESAPAETSAPATESAPADAPAATENTVTQ